MRQFPSAHRGGQLGAILWQPGSDPLILRGIQAVKWGVPTVSRSTVDGGTRRKPRSMFGSVRAVEGEPQGTWGQDGGAWGDSSNRPSCMGPARGE